jgi:SNF2 family DNA or RNA helicase
MGLGKTIQTLACLTIEKETNPQNPSIIISPTSLVANWSMEIEKFAPHLKTLILHGSERKKYFEHIQAYDLVLTTYPLVLRDEETLIKEQFNYVILDEAKFIKNHRAKSSRVIFQLKANHRLCLSGTPMENHLGELWSQFRFLAPGLLGTTEKFKRIFRTPIEKHHAIDRRTALANRIKPFMMRRTKSEVAIDLPPKTEIIKTTSLDGKQRDLYESIRSAMDKKVRDSINKQGLKKSHIIVLDALLKLRQTCCDPRLLTINSAKAAHGQSAKLKLLTDMMPNMIEEGRKVILFSQFTSMIDLIKKEFDQLNIKYTTLTGSTKDRKTPIHEFQNGDTPVIIISLKAGGVGLNLTAADTVIHYDPWWNPAVENQATDRAHRIGQDKPVFVYKLITEGTVEETIVEMQKKKQDIVEGLLSENQNTKKPLQADDLNELFKPLGHVRRYQST